MDAVPTRDFFFGGEHYLDFLEALGRHLRPASYFEIGTNAGDSLARVTCDALCVDPEFVLAGGVARSRRRTLLFQMSSDEFFAAHDLRAYFPGGFDLALLDGLHWFEFLLRDFINTEGVAHRNSLVLLHDCMPANARMAERTMRLVDGEDGRTRFGWAGDVWKMVAVLHEYRPDLLVRVLDCPPTGLVAVSGLDPTSTVLRANYHAILERYAGLDLDGYGLERLHGLFPVVDSRRSIGETAITARFTVR